MSKPEGKLLVVEDDRAMGEVLHRDLSRSGFDVDLVVDPLTGLTKVEANDYDVILTDLRLPGMNGVELCRRARAIRPSLPVIVMTAFGSLETAMEAMRSGAYDFITKPFDLDSAELVIRRAVEYHRLKDELHRLRARTRELETFDELVGESPTMRRLFDVLDRVKDSDVTVLVTGENGTGKELVARALHRLGRRGSGPFVAVNCAAVPETLLESELFGHEKGAFTDARSARKGLMLEASGGTLFLDEIGELPLAMQAKLLRVLQDKAVRPVGANREIPCDVRILAATNRDLQAAIEAGRFREDLYFRLAVIEIEVPPLRARGNDVLLLAQRFMERAAEQSGRAVRSFDQDVARKLLRYRWPGNVRELANCVERAVALARYDEITIDDLPERIREYEPSHVFMAAENPNDFVPLEEVERRYILRVLEAVNGHRTSAAKILGLDRKTLYRKLERWGAAGTED